MKRVYVFLLLAQSLYGQQLVNHSVEQLLPNYVSPNTQLEDFSLSVLSDFDTHFTQFNVPITTTYDEFSLGGGYLHSDAYKGANFYLSSNEGKIKMSIIGGYYKTETREATYGGASLSYHHEKGYVGVTIRDIFDVAIEDGTDVDFYNYEAMTPQLFAKHELYNDNFKVNGFVNVSMHDIEKLNYRAALETIFNETITLGGGYSKYNKWMAYSSIQFSKFHLLGSFDGDFYVGLRYK